MAASATLARWIPKGLLIVGGVSGVSGGADHGAKLSRVSAPVQSGAVVARQLDAGSTVAGPVDLTMREKPAAMRLRGDGCTTADRAAAANAD